MAPPTTTRVLLLEGINPNAAQAFRNAGYANVECLSGALSAAQLQEKIANAQVLGIRSHTRLTAEALRHAPELLCVGCFCIGTNQVDLNAAKRAGTPVFNAPYSNTRSVAELVIGEIIMLMRGVHEKSMLAHSGIWAKNAALSHEIRGKVLGIVGYGHIGTQASILAEAMGMRVFYYDIVDRLSVGNAKPLGSLDELLHIADVVSLHVPGTQQTAGMITASKIALMKKGSHLINASRGNVVDLDALASALREGHLAGAAVDVFPVEPSSAEQELVTPLRGLNQVILTPHVGGSTNEAQVNIGIEVTDKLMRYCESGTTMGAVNFVEVSLPREPGAVRFLHVHTDVPGVLSAINKVFSSRALNIAGQHLRTDGEIGYVVVDVDGPVADVCGIKSELAQITGTTRVRCLDSQPRSDHACDSPRARSTGP